MGAYDGSNMNVINQSFGVTIFENWLNMLVAFDCCFLRGWLYLNILGWFRLIFWYQKGHLGKRPSSIMHCQVKVASHWESVACFEPKDVPSLKLEGKFCCVEMWTGVNWCYVFLLFWKVVYITNNLVILWFCRWTPLVWVGEVGVNLNEQYFEHKYVSSIKDYGLPDWRGQCSHQFCSCISYFTVGPCAVHQRFGLTIQSFGFQRWLQAPGPVALGTAFRGPVTPCHCNSQTSKRWRWRRCGTVERAWTS